MTKKKRNVLLLASMIILVGLLITGMQLHWFSPAYHALAKKQYVTATKEFQKLIDAAPDSAENRLGYLKALYYGGEGLSAYGVMIEMSGKYPSLEKCAEYNKIRANLYAWYTLHPTLINLEDEYVSRKQSGYREALQEFINKNPHDVPSRYIMASELKSIGQYAEAEALLLSIIEDHPEFADARLLLSALYRDMAEFEKGAALLDALIADNPEQAALHAARARLALKDHQDAEGLDYALTAYALSPGNEMVLFTICLAYHYNGEVARRDAVLQTMRNAFQFDQLLLAEAEAVIDGSAAWR